MSRNKRLPAWKSQLIIPVALVAAGFVAGAICLFPNSAISQEMGPLQKDHPGQASTWTADVQPQRTLVHFQDNGTPGAPRSGWAVLPGSASSYHLKVAGPEGAKAVAAHGFQTLRGAKALRVEVFSALPGPVTVTVEHDGDWGLDKSGSQARLFSPALHGAAGLEHASEGKAGNLQRGTYLIVHGPAFTNAMAPLVDWKTRKGFQVQTVSTGQTGSSAAGIKAYLQEAYDTWDFPPEYILLLGDVGDIPTYSFYGNPSDLPYTLLEGEDWLPDAMIGRLPVENDTQAQTVINKIVAYERNPFEAGTSDWFTRSIMVGGVEGSDTPPHTVRFCGEQLEKIGFAPAQTFLHPPLPSNMFIASMFNPALDTGASLVAYRGWAYGTAGWSDPRYEVNDMGGMNNLGRLPVVMSFVCLNGDYTASSPCFGEAFLRQGQPDQSKGAVAFIGNGEHWSHTRYNDAMAISFFERIISPEITDLGSLMTAGKLRFHDYFPHEIDAETFGEESVEFYFHIYNLLGDPELNFWKSTPRSLEVTHPASLPVGSNFLDAQIDDAGSGAPVAGAVVTVVAQGQLLGAALTDDSGLARVSFPPLNTGMNLELTVSGAGLVTYEGLAGVASASALITATGAAVDDGSGTGQGNGDGMVNPGESIQLTLTVANSGSGSSGAFSLSLTEVDGPATATGGSVDFTALGAGGTATAGLPLGLAIDPEARDGDEITVMVTAERTGGAQDHSTLSFQVSAPDLQGVSLAKTDGTVIEPGQNHNLGLNLISEGSVGTSGGHVELELIPSSGATLLTGSADFGACASGEAVTTTDALVLQLAPGMHVGTNLSFLCTITTLEGYVSQTTVGLVIGSVDVAAVSGPDDFGYYAYDSADLDYPASRPQYRWREISPTFGGSGTPLDFPVDNEIVNVQVDLPFSFKFYGQDYSRIRVSDNGWIAFDLAPNYNFYNWPIPSEHGNNALIAPFWENLVPTGDGGPNGIPVDGIYYHHDPTAGTFTVEWSRLHHYKPQILGLQTFQVVLLDPASHPTASGNGEILFYYRDVTNEDYVRNYATVGIESTDGRDGLQLSYAAINTPGQAPLQPGLAIKLTTETPVRIPFALSEISAQRASSQVRLQWLPADDRPVLGWHVDRVDDEGVHRLTSSPLAASTQEYLAPVGVAEDSGPVVYKLTALHPFGTSSQPGQVTLDSPTALQMALHRAVPNPATGQSSIAFALPREGAVRLRVFDAAGRLVRTLIDGPAQAGEGQQTWDGRDERGTPAAGGVYFFRLDAAGQTLTRKVIMVR